jgi:hypothetical protein
MWAEHASAGPPSSIRGDTLAQTSASFSVEQERPLLAQPTPFNLGPLSLANGVFSISRPAITS